MTFGATSALRAVCRKRRVPRGSGEEATRRSVGKAVAGGVTAAAADEEEEEAVQVDVDAAKAAAMPAKGRKASGR